MKHLFCKTKEKIISRFAYGSQVQIERGIASTLLHPHDCNIGWFAGESTVILGAGHLSDDQANDITVAKWHIPIEPGILACIQSGFLVIACERRQGGLHTRVYGAQAKVNLNGYGRDIIGLKRKPNEHTDYFHRVPTPKLPDIWPISGCGTVYAWPVHKDHLVAGGTQVVQLEIDRGVSWDIDYVMLVLNIVESISEIPNWVQQIIYLIIGAIVGALAVKYL